MWNPGLCTGIYISLGKINLGSLKMCGVTYKEAVVLQFNFEILLFKHVKFLGKLKYCLRYSKIVNFTYISIGHLLNPKKSLWTTDGPIKKVCMYIICNIYTTYSYNNSCDYLDKDLLSKLTLLVVTALLCFFFILP